MLARGKLEGWWCPDPAGAAGAIDRWSLENLMMTVMDWHRHCALALRSSPVSKKCQDGEEFLHGKGIGLEDGILPCFSMLSLGKQTGWWPMEHRRPDQGVERLAPSSTTQMSTWF
jgi:hypothetical protein